MFMVVLLFFSFIRIVQFFHGDDRRIRATIKRKVKKKQENGPLFQQQIKDVEELNQQYKDIIKQKNM
jgi:hypothetical protein